MQSCNMLLKVGFICFPWSTLIWIEVYRKRSPALLMNRIVTRLDLARHCVCNNSTSVAFITHRPGSQLRGRKDKKKKSNGSTLIRRSPPFSFPSSEIRSELWPVSPPGPPEKERGGGGGVCLFSALPPQPCQNGWLWGCCVNTGWRHDVMRSSFYSDRHYAYLLVSSRTPAPACSSLPECILWCSESRSVSEVKSCYSRGTYKEVGEEKTTLRCLLCRKNSTS